MDRDVFFLLKEKFFKNWFYFQDFIRVVARFLKPIFSLLFILASLFYFGVLIIHQGFNLSEVSANDFFRLYHSAFYVIYFSKYFLELLELKKRKLIGWIYEGALFLFSTLILLALLIPIIFKSEIRPGFPGLISLIIVTGLLIISKIHKLMSIIDNIKLSPSLLFVLSFLLIILIGSGLLMLPKAHVGSFSYLDSLFTSASAVCVTGLIVMDTATSFTFLGKTIILSLIQIGGIGIMAFTGFFGFIFTGTVSFKDRLLLKDIVSSENLGGVYKLITKIISITFLIEMAGAIVIYFSIGTEMDDKLFFSIFHSISAFCNAGFSTLQAGLGSAELQGNYWVSMTIATLIILGGIGFPVLLMFYSYAKNTGFRLVNSARQQKMPAANLNKNIGVRIAIYTTLLLLFLGTMVYYFLERNHSLNGLTGIDQFIVAFFGSVSARTAGFNVVDITQWTYPTLFFMVFLMWVGASPGSTGGGVKTTTFALSLHAVYNFIRGRNTIEIGFRQIGNETISRVLVVIVLSMLTIMIGYFGLLLAEPYLNPVHLLFECVSAYGTVGLSIVNTSTLSNLSKEIIIVMMFVGRVGPLTLLSGMFTLKKKRYYRYPVQDLIIN